MRWGWLAVAGIGLYLLLFYATPLADYATGTDVMRRGQLVAETLLLIDVQVGYWLGEPGEWGVLDRAPILAIVAGIVIVAICLGDVLLRLLGIAKLLQRTERLALAAGAGLSAISLYTLAVGLCGGLQSRWWFLAPAILLLVAELARVWKRRRGLQIPATSATNKPTGVAGEAKDELPSRWLWAAAPFALVIVLGGMLPPIEFDVREYHLQAPKEFHQHGRIAFAPHNVYANMPLGAEMFALLGMALSGDWWTGALVGKTTIALFAPLTALGLRAAGGRFFSPTAGVVAALVYLSTPWVARLANLGLIEGAFACYGFLALYAMLLATTKSVGWDEGRVPPDGRAESGERKAGENDQGSMPTDQRIRFVALAGFFAGSAVACKYPAVLFVVAPLSVWCGWANKERRVLSVAVFLLAAAAGCGLWLAKNWVQTGNPVYPLLASAIPSETRSVAKIEQWRAAHGPPNFSPGDAVRRLGDFAWRSPWLGGLTIPLAALALADPRRRRLAAWLWAYCGFVLLAWWLLTHRIDRFWMPVLPVLALLSGGGFVWLRSQAGKWAASGLLAMVLVASFLLIVRGPVVVGAGAGARLVLGPGGFARYFVALDALRTSAERVDPWHRALNQSTQPGEAILSVGDAQVFDLEMPVYYNTVFDESLFEQWLRGRAPEDFHQELIERNIRYVLVDWGEIARYRSPGNYGFTDFVEPERFAQLQAAGVLGRPLPGIEGRAAQVFPVLAPPAQIRARSASE